MRMINNHHNEQWCLWTTGAIKLTLLLLLSASTYYANNNAIAVYIAKITCN